jgi:broad specificity phosphatase PhoE
MLMANQVRFFLMRHPKHTNDVVGPEGVAQIEAATRELIEPLVGGQIHYAYATEKQRAKQTARVVLETLGMCVPVVVDPHLGFQYIEDEWPKYDFTPAVEEINKRRSDGQFVSVHDMVHELWIPAMVVRHVLRATMAKLVERHRLSFPEAKCINVLIGNHASNVLACPYPRAVDGYPPNCSVAMYTYGVSSLGATMEDFQLLIPSGS